MTREEAITQLKMDRDLCNFNPMTGEEEPMNEDCRKSAEALEMAIKALEQQPCEDTISRQAAIDAMEQAKEQYFDRRVIIGKMQNVVSNLPSAQPEQRYTEEELRVFAHGISLSLLSKRSAQHWRYDKDTATEIEFLERLYDKVGADIRGERQ